MTALLLSWAVSVAVLGPPSPGPEPGPGPAPAPDPDRDCSIVWTGYVTEAGTDEGIPNAQLSYLRPEQDPRYLRTGEDGGFRVEGLCPGPIQVSVRKAEHSTLELELELAEPTTESMLELEALHDHHSSRVIVIHDEGQPSTSASESLSGAALSRTRGQGLADAISGMAGVSVLRGPAGGMGKPIIRGHLGRRTLILVDGIRHEGQEWGLDHAPEVDPNAAGRITVIKGAGTTRYGSEANGGVVLLESRPLLRQPGVAGEVVSFGHSNALGGGGSARLDYAPLRGRGLAFRAEGNVARHRAAITPDYPLDNTGAWTWNTGARIGYLSDPIDVEVGYRVMRSRLGICSCLQIGSVDEFSRGLAAREPVGADLYSPEFAIDRPKQEIWHHLASARVRLPIAEAGELHLTYSFQFNDRREFDVVRANVSGPQIQLGLATHLGELGFEHAAVHMGDWALVGTVGAAIGQQRNDFTGATTLVPDSDQWSWSVYDVERFVHDRVEIELGVRYDGARRTATLDDRDYSGQAAGDRLDPELCHATDSGGVCTPSFHMPSATIGLLARPIRKLPELSLRTQLNSSARMPAIDEQFMNGAAPSFPILGFGSSKIGVERTWGGESTLRYEGDWLTIEGSGYASWIDDYIAFMPEPQAGQCAPLTCTTRGPFPVYVFRPTDALFAGAELHFDLLAPRLPLGLSGNAAWVRARDLGADSFLPLIPSDRYSLAGRWFWSLPTREMELSSRGYLEINGTVVARQTRVDPALDFAAPPPAYVLLGAAVGLEFPTGDQIIRTSLVGTNLLNMRYREYTSLLRYFADEPGWGLQLRIGVEFDVGA